MRLVGGNTADDVAFGVPEIFHAGAWGTFCDGDDFRFDYVEGSQYNGISTFNDVRPSQALPSPRPVPIAVGVPCNCVKSRCGKPDYLYEISLKNPTALSPLAAS